MQSNVTPCNTFGFSHISSLTTTVSHFLHYSLVDQLYAKEVYFYSLVAKFNHTSTKYSSDVFNSFYCHTWRVPWDFHQPTSNEVSPHFNNTREPLPFVASLFFHEETPSSLQKLHNMSIGPEKPTHALFFHIKQNSLFKVPFFTHTGTALSKVHADSIEPDVPLLTELEL